MTDEINGIRKIALLYTGAVVWTPTYLLPFNIEESMARFGLSESSAGWLASAVLLCLSLSIVIFGRRMATLNKRTGALVAAALAVLSTGAMFSHDFHIFVAAKMVLGVALGVSCVCAYGVIAHVRHPEKVAAQVAVAMAIIFSAAMYVVPIVNAKIGAIGVDAVQFVIVVAALFLGVFMHPAVNAAEENVAKDAIKSSDVRAMLVSAFFIYVSQTALMGFATEVAATRGVAAEQLGILFMINAAAQLPAGIAVTWLGDRLGLFKPIAFGLALLIACSVGMYCVGGRWAFLVSTALISAGATLVAPYMVAALSKMDTSGRSTATCASAINLGLAVGPAIAGTVFGVAGLRAVGWLSVGLLVVPIFLTSVAIRQLKSRHARPAIA
ncbi:MULTISPECIES: MFS transporter [Burkholderia]|nr:MULTISPECIES: MFS transporter [Burkholderia]MDP9547062.1 putative MFS family arabinose efflux permease [Burkholderia cepacia]KWF20960.1 MFS transporter [Burkholderia cenocepacia]MBJ9897299.1 MFS transporter [Burkholderia cenocepacia]MBJ9914387.1 MFS transporter [Burkholderia cenocepacia]MBR7965298.1 MFS transporter [Burkholderia cenocepacia]